MPSWANHFRVADKLLDNIKNLNTEYFIIGNIAPDCGVPTGNNGEYLPSSAVTHFTVNDISNKSDCDYNYICENYIQNETDMNRKSFFVGYFVHLFTDCAYALDIYRSIENKYGEFSKTPGLWKQVSAECYNIDCSYLAGSISPSFELFKTYNGFDELYPEWYKNGEIPWQMKNIVNFYASLNPKNVNYQYVTPEQITGFIDRTAEHLLNEIKIRNILL